MLREEAILEIKMMARHGMSIRAIAGELRISRNTVRKYLRGEAVADEAGRGPGRPSKLGPYEDWLRRRVEAARPVKLPATVLWREIRAPGLRPCGALRRSTSTSIAPQMRYHASGVDDRLFSQFTDFTDARTEEKTPSQSHQKRAARRHGCSQARGDRLLRWQP